MKVPLRNRRFVAVESENDNGEMLTVTVKLTNGKTIGLKTEFGEKRYSETQERIDLIDMAAEIEKFALDAANAVMVKNGFTPKKVKKWRWVFRREEPQKDVFLGVTKYHYGGQEEYNERNCTPIDTLIQRIEETMIEVDE